MPRPMILVADDEAHVTFMLSRKIQREGADVLVASNGDEALQLARDRLPQLVITDYQMPVLSGFELAVTLRQTAGTANIPVIMLTARGHRLSPADLAQTNIRRLISKPFSMREVLTRINELVDLNRDPKLAIGQTDGAGAA